MFDHAAVAGENRAGSHRQRTGRDISIDHRGWSQLDSLLSDNVAVNGAADNADSHIDVGIDARRVVNDQRSFVGKDFSRDESVNAQHVLERDLSVEFGWKIV